VVYHFLCTRFLQTQRDHPKAIVAAKRYFISPNQKIVYDSHLALVMEVECLRELQTFTGSF
jgi:hypothetical protein